MEEDQRRFGIPWIIIIICLFCFAPLGVFLIYKKLTTEKTTAVYDGCIMSAFGWLIFLFGMAILVETIYYYVLTKAIDKSLIGAFIFFSVIGLILILVAKRRRKNGRKYRMYINIIANQHITSIDNIAAAINTEYNTVLMDIQKMIDMGYFRGSHIDKENRKIVMPETHQIYDTTPNEPTTRIMKCNNCGANNKIKVGAAAECEYCGSPLS